MLQEIRYDRECYSYPTHNLEISTYNQKWDEESLKELREEGIFFMSKGDSVHPIKLICNDLTKEIKGICIGVEDDGTLFFNIKDWFSVNWIDSLMGELQAVKEYISKL